jgi:hypothetical protein
VIGGDQINDDPSTATACVQSAAHGWSLLSLIYLATLPYTDLRQVQSRPTLREVAGRAFDPVGAGDDSAAGNQ